MDNAVVIVPTLNPGVSWIAWMDAYDAQTVKPLCYVIDSSSDDDVVEQASKRGYDVTVIDRSEFDHGGTRQKAISEKQGYEFVIFLTQDAMLSGADSLKNILAPFDDERVGAVCGHQLPRLGAGPIEAHGRSFSYSQQSRVLRIEDRLQFGMKAAFLSNAFSAYRVQALQERGGFPSRTIGSEDMYVGAAMLLNGWKIAYAADAKVYHSHDYSVLQEFNRYFDIGVFHARESWIRQELGAAEGEGLRFLRSEMSYLLKHAWWRIPEALLRTLMKYSGYRLGLLDSILPKWIKHRLAMNPVFFR